MNNYKCKLCGKIIEDESNKQWIKSYCMKHERNTHLILQKNDSKRMAQNRQNNT